MTNTKSPTDYTAAIDTMNVARNHADSQRAQMGDAWADELIAWHEANTIEAVDAYVATFTNAADEIVVAMRARLLAHAGIK